MENLKSTPQMILSAVQTLSSKLENCISGVNDQITALSKQVKTNDKSTTDSIKTITSKTDTIKTVLEQKSNTIIDKTTTVLDKVKSYSEVIKSNTAQIQNSESSIRMKPAATNPSQMSERRTIDSQQKSAETQKSLKPKTKPGNQTKNRRGNENKQNENDVAEQIDLTLSPKRVKTTNKSTLLVGSSILKNVKVNDLKNNTTVRSFPGATINSLKRKLSGYNIDECKTVVLHVGGNDADSGSDLDPFTDDYEQLIDTLSVDSRRVIVSGLLPRETVDLGPYNDKLKTLCEDKGLQFIDNYKGFLLASGEMPESYFGRDKVHLNSHGTKRLLRNIDNIFRITKGNSGPSNTGQTYQPQPRLYGMPLGDRRQFRSPRYCHICCRKGHSTSDCWFNGRNAGLME